MYLEEERYGSGNVLPFILIMRSMFAEFLFSSALPRKNIFSSPPFFFSVLIESELSVLSPVFRETIGMKQIYFWSHAPMPALFLRPFSLATSFFPFTLLQLYCAPLFPLRVSLARAPTPTRGDARRRGRMAMSSSSGPLLGFLSVTPGVQDLFLLLFFSDLYKMHTVPNYPHSPIFLLTTPPCASGQWPHR